MSKQYTVRSSGKTITLKGDTADEQKQEVLQLNATGKLKPADAGHILTVIDSRFKNNKPLTFKVSEKRAVSVYGLMRFPVTLYSNAWSRLLSPENVAALLEFITDHEDELSVKEAA